MFNKIVLTCSLSLFSFSSHAFFFDSMKCSNSVAVEALKKGIYSKASSSMQAHYITDRTDFFSKDISVFLEKMYQLDVAVSNVVTRDNKNNVLYCEASITVKLPDDILAFIQEKPEKFFLFVEGRGAFADNRVSWKNSQYSLNVADNKKEVVLSSLSERTTGAPEVLNAIAIFSETLDDRRRLEADVTMNDAKSRYFMLDRRLNDTWKGFSDAVKKSMRNEQNSWIKSKESECGKLADTERETVNPETKIAILVCQSDMTEKRINYLGGQTPAEFTPRLRSFSD